MKHVVKKIAAFNGTKTLINTCVHQICVKSPNDLISGAIIKVR